jgi:hypothetical protein
VKANHLEESVKCQALDWAVVAAADSDFPQVKSGEAEATLAKQMDARFEMPPPYDFILIADCLYYYDVHALLAAVVKKVTAVHTLVILAFPIRSGKVSSPFSR